MRGKRSTCWELSIAWFRDDLIDMTINPYPVPRSSSLPDIAWLKLTGGSPGWLTFSRTGLLLLMAAVAFI